MSLNVIVLKEKPNVSYYLSDELKVNNPVYFTGTAKTIRKIIEKKNIPETEYIYATTLKKEWKLCDPSCKKGKLLLTKNWCDTNNLVTKIQTELNINKTEENKEDDDEENNEILQEDIIQAPEILLLQDHEKFRDSNGKIIEIETRGEKNEDKIYFKVTDVSVGFNLPSLKDVILKEDRGYQRNIDYVTFTIVDDINKNLKKKRIYLTYNGFVKYITKSRKYIPDTLTSWLTELLGIPFVHHRFITPETDTINSIVKILDCKYIKEYKIEKYRVDLYIPEYDLVIECDENDHKYRDIEYEKDRENYIQDKLKCILIRYDPYSKNFDIFNIIKQINTIIKIQEEMKHENEKMKYENEKIKQEMELETMKHKMELEKCEKEMLKKEMKIQELEHINKYRELELKMKEMELLCLKNNIKN